MLSKKKAVAVVVAHPDDETLWAGGTILKHATCDWFVVSLCRGTDPDRSPKFFKALNVFKAEGIMGDLDDGPEQKPLDSKLVENAILDLLPVRHFDMIISHSPTGEYTKHIRHEETGRAVINLWYSNRVSSNILWVFAYDDRDKTYLPRSSENAAISNTLSKHIWERKYKIITDIYGFDIDSWEARTTPKTEGFWEFTYPAAALKWLKETSKNHHGQL